MLARKEGERWETSRSGVDQEGWQALWAGWFGTAVWAHLRSYRRSQDPGRDWWRRRGWLDSHGPKEGGWRSRQATHECSCLCQVGPTPWMARGKDGQIKGRTKNAGKAADEKRIWQTLPVFPSPVLLLGYLVQDLPPPEFFCCLHLTFFLFFQIITHLPHFA